MFNVEIESRRVSMKTARYLNKTTSSTSLSSGVVNFVQFCQGNNFSLFSNEVCNNFISPVGLSLMRCFT